jgi:regulator of RNase E activity RraA
MTMNIPLPELCERYKRLYTPLVCDVMDTMGLWYQCLGPDIMPLTFDMRVAGPAFTMAGYDEHSTDKSIRLGAAAIDHLPLYSVAVMQTNGNRNTGHWGELLTNGAIKRGCQGAVIDGGVRDTSRILALGFPLFSKFRCAGDARGRWNVVEFGSEIACAGVRVRPGDFIFGDADGVMVIPQEITIEVLLKSEENNAIEDEIREKIRQGASLGEMYQQVEVF